MARPERQCCACRQTHPKDELLRFVSGPDGAPTLDLREKLPGRGAYLCPRMECLRKGLRPKGIGRALGCGAPSLSAEELRTQALEGLGRLLNEQLGHAHRMGAVVWGGERVTEALDAGQVDWILVAADAAQRLLTDMSSRADGRRVYRGPDKAELGRVLGPAEVGVVAVTHPPMAEKIQALAVRWNRLREENGDGQG
ncbi:YlxR family protein [Thiohalorhabdus denitrificans]|uniref:YlxR domain-containing protein n=1 Tax=Thiohalorhabdus denitrificans TaxID=381306 RepID=A0A1G5H5W4_9GAMM|nr:YlxR family protein [Thiohalorhabdus denitrificans]SCY59265.1 hypothetical protein SAMN05661077_2596 [Thiohalorhabdus denitrificans]